MNEYVLTKGEEYIRAGMYVVPVNAQKEPLVGTWSKDGPRLTLEEFQAKSRSPQAAGLAIITGPISAGLNLLDIDTKNDPQGAIWEEYAALIRDQLPELWDRLAIATTPTKGYHIYYRWSGKEGNKVLARTPATDENGNTTPRAIIETRGYGGYAVVPPGDGREFTQGDLLTAPELTDEERATLIGLAKSLDRMPAPEPVRPTMPRSITGDRPGDDYNRKTDILDLLTARGWTIVRDGSGKVYVKRPGNSTAAHSGNVKDGKLWVWSTSTDLPTDRTLAPFDAYTYWHHNGDYKAAAKELHRQGYGQQFRAPQVVQVDTVQVNGQTPTGDVEIAAPGDKLDTAQVKQVDARTVYIVCADETQPEEVYRILATLETHTTPRVYIVTTDGEQVRPSTYRLGVILDQLPDPLGDQGIDMLLDQVTETAVSIVDPVERSMFVKLVERLETWEEIGVKPGDIRERLAASMKQAEDRAYRAEMAETLEEIAQKIGDQAPLGDIQKSLKKLASYGDTKGMTAGLVLATMEEIQEELDKVKDGIKAGIYQLDKAGLVFRPGTFSLIGARTHNGKTLLLLNLAVWAALHYPDKRFYYVGYEEPAGLLFQRIHRLIAGQGVKGQGDDSQAMQDAKKIAKELIDQGRLNIVQGQPALEALTRDMIDLADRGLDIGGVYVDYVQRIRLAGQYNSLREKNVAISEQLKDLAIAAMTPVIAAAQLNRQAEQGKDGRPQLQHLKESGNLEEDASNVLLLYAKDWDEHHRMKASKMTSEESPDYSEFQIDLQKSRGIPPRIFNVGAWRYCGRVVNTKNDPAGAWKLDNQK